MLASGQCLPNIPNDDLADRDAWLKFDCTTVRECQVSTSSCERLLSLSCVFTPTALCLQSDYKGLRLYGKTRGLTHTNALYLEYLDGVRVPRPALKVPWTDLAKPFVPTDTQIHGSMYLSVYNHVGCLRFEAGANPV